MAIGIALLGFHISTSASAETVFYDDFGESSRGLRERNLVVDPPPAGMGYKTDTPYGYRLKNWLIADEETDRERRAFWCIPENHEGDVEAVMKQAARSRNSIAYARTMIPQSAVFYRISFRQWCNDNDKIGFVLGASQPLVAHDGIEFYYQRQIPGTDTTVNDIYYDGALGNGKIDGKAFMKRWVDHRIDVDGPTIRWFQNGELMLEGDVNDMPRGGYFGIRQRYERGTRYDDVKIEVLRADKSAIHRPPNVLFIAVDDLRCDLGCYGNSQVHSPNIDRLASSGVRFESAYCQYPICNASRVSVLTGLRPDTNGARFDHENNSYHFRRRLPHTTTLPQLFQRAGYRVGRIGKLYHYGVPREIGTESALDDRASWQYALYPRGAEKDEEDLLISYTPKKSVGWALSWRSSPAGSLEHTDGLVATGAIRLMQEQRKAPFFLAVGFYRPHVPAIAPEAYFSHYPYEQVSVEAGPEGHLDQIPPAAFETRLRTDRPMKDLRWFKRAYYATVSYVDEQIGRVVQAVEDLGLSDRTIVVLWSDHGWMLGEHGQWEKRVLFEESVRVPMIIRAPGVAGNGLSCARVVELVDLYPTLAELCGLDPPDYLEGQSLMPLLQNPQAEWKDVAFSQVGRRDVIGRSVRTPRWRFTQWDHGKQGEQLYDHDDDPHEYKNLAKSPELSGTVKGLRGLLNARFADFRSAEAIPGRGK